MKHEIIFNPIKFGYQEVVAKIELRQEPMQNRVVKVFEFLNVKSNPIDHIDIIINTLCSNKLLYDTFVENSSKQTIQINAFVKLLDTTSTWKE